MQTKRSYGSGSLNVRSLTPPAAAPGTGCGATQAGKRIKRRLGPVRERGASVGLSRAEAETELRRQIAERHPSDDRVVPSHVRLTVGGVGSILLERQLVAGRAASTRRALEVVLRCHLVPFFGERSLASIERHDVDRLMAHLLAQGKAPKTCQNVRGDLAAICNYAVREGWLARSPVPGSITPQVAECDDLRFLSVEQVHQLARLGPPAEDELDAIGRRKRIGSRELARVEGDLYLVAALTGMRQGELLGLDFAQVDFEAQVIRVVRQWHAHERVFGPTKGKRKRWVPMGRVVAEVIARRSLERDGSGLVFADELGEPLSRHRISGPRFAEACRRAGVPIVTFHELRHTFGTQMARSGADVGRIQFWMGHQHLVTTERYMHYAPAADEAALIDAAFARAEH